MNGNKIKETIVDFFNEIRKQYPEVTTDMLELDGAIHYMNGNDGTGFDWACNDRVCEFYIWYNERLGNRGFIKVFLGRFGKLSAYVYLDHGDAAPISVAGPEISAEDALQFAFLLQQEADDKDIYDSPISQINFTPDSVSEYSWEEDEDEEDEWEDDEEE